MAAAHRRRRTLRASCMAVGVASASCNVWAGDYLWNLPDGSTGVWNVPGNWLGNHVPIDGDTARFNAAGSFVSTFSATAATDALRVSAGSVNIRSDGSALRTLRVNEGPGDLIIDGGTLAFGGVGVAVNPMSVAVSDSVNVERGALLFQDAGSILSGTSATAVHIVGGNGGVGTFTVRDGAVAELLGTLNVGNGILASTRGTIDLESGAKLDVQRIQLATIAGAAEASLNVSDARLFVRDALVLGNGGTLGSARLTINAGATVTLQTTGHVINATGHIVQTGGAFDGGGGLNVVGGRIDVSGGTFSFGTSTTLSGGAVANLTAPGGLSTDGGALTASGSATSLNVSAGLRVNGGVINLLGGARSSVGGLTVGTGNGVPPSIFTAGGGSALTVNGGDVAVDVATMTLTASGFRQTGAGSFRVDGLPAAPGDWSADASTMETGSGPATIGRYGRVGLLNQSVWTTHGNLTIDGGTLDAVGGTLSLDPARTLTIRNGATATLPSLKAAGATLLVRDAGTTLTLGGTLDANAKLTINAGARLAVPASKPLTLDRVVALIGDGTAADSRIDVRDTLRITGNGAILSIAAGGTVDLSAETGQPTLEVWDHAVVAETGGRLAIGDRTTLRLNHAGTLLADGGPVTLNGAARIELNDASTFRAGGTLTLSTAGTASVQATNSNVFGTTLKLLAGSYQLTGGISTFTGTGAGNVIGGAANPSTATFADGHIARFDAPLIVGNANSTPRLTVRGGAQLSTTSDDVTIGATGDSAPVVELADLNSSITANGGSVFLGGHAVVNVRNAATLTAGNAIEIDRDAILNLDGGHLVAKALRGSTASGSAGTFTWTRGNVRLRDVTTIAPGTLLGTTSLELGQDKILSVDSNLTLASGATLRLNGGRLEVGGTFDRQGSLIWTAGDLHVGGVARLGGSGSLGTSLTIAAGQSLRSQTRLSVGSGGQLVLAGGVAAAPAIEVLSGGEVLLSSPVNRFAADGNAAIANTGLIHGDGTVGSLANAGELRGEDGKRLRIDGTLSNSGRLNLVGGTIESTATLSNATAGVISGRGTLITRGLTNSGSIAFSGGLSDVFGDVVNAGGGRVTISGNANVTFWDDVTNAAGGSFRVSPGSVATFFGTYAGGGVSGGGAANIEGDLTPGFSPAAVQFDGDLSLGPAARLVIELGGTIAGSEYDRVSVGGTLSVVDGTPIDLVAMDGFQPLPGDVFTILDFAAVDGDPAVRLSGRPRGLHVDERWAATDLTVHLSAIAGDADLDADVDFADLLALARHYNAADGARWTEGDFDGDGRVMFGDLLALAKHYGERDEPAAFAADWALAQSLTPEPTFGGIAILLAGHRRRRPCRPRSATH